MIKGNQIDQAGCTTEVASTDIQHGNFSDAAVGQISILDNYALGGSGRALNAFGIASDSSSALSNVVIMGNKASGSAVKNLFANNNTLPTSTATASLRTTSTFTLKCLGVMGIYG